MQSVGRKLAFVLASSSHGTMIVNRFDYRMVDLQRGYGVGYQILDTASLTPRKSSWWSTCSRFAARITATASWRWIAAPISASIPSSGRTAMTGWGSVLAIEAQERIYYALAGNIAINNCFNAIAVHGAVSSESGTLTFQFPTISSRPASAALTCANARQRVHRPADRL